MPAFVFLEEIGNEENLRKEDLSREMKFYHSFSICHLGEQINDYK